MCLAHWAMVPADIRARVRAAFAPGRAVSEEWLAAVDAAVAAVAAVEGRSPPAAPAPAHPLDGLLAISVHQPYAACLAKGWKSVENRFKLRVPPEHLGRPVAIHATSRVDLGEEEEVLRVFAERGALGGLDVKPSELERGAIVGLAVLTQVVDASDAERAAICAEGNPWVTGPLLLCFDAALPIRPVRVPGKPDLWRVEGAALDAVKLHWNALSTPRARAARAHFTAALAHWGAIARGVAPAEVPRLPERRDFLAAEEARAATERRVSGGEPAAAPPPPAARPLPAPPPPGDWFVLLDTETANSRPPIRLVEIAAILVDGDSAQEFESLIRPPVPIEPSTAAVHGITDAQVAGAPGAPAVLERLAPWLRGATVVAHNVSFDKRVVEAEYRLAGAAPPSARWCCSLKAARRLLPGEPSHKLGDLAARLGVARSAAHRALGDARTTLGVLRAIAARSGLTLAQVIERGAPDPHAAGRGGRRGREADVDV